MKYVDIAGVNVNLDRVDGITALRDPDNKSYPICVKVMFKASLNNHVFYLHLTNADWMECQVTLANVFGYTPRLV